MIFFEKIEEKEMNESVLELEKSLNELKNKRIPDNYPRLIQSFEFVCRLLEIGRADLYRDAFTNISWPLLSNNWVDELIPLLKNKKVLEIMSGTGALASVLNDKGINIIATELYQEYHSNIWKKAECIDAVEAIEKYGKECDYLLYSWPGMSDLMYRCLLKMREVNPEMKLIYIGEFGDCCANEEFVDEANMLYNEYIEKANSKFISWSGVHDEILLIN